jgi:trans-aconitate methyltransferase
MEQTSDYIRACYDAVAPHYAERFATELAHKPLDRELLTRFAAEVRGRGQVYDLGCGPGQTTAFLHGCGVSVRGLDISTGLLHEARQTHPGVEFEPGDILELPLADASLAGVTAFYAIVHLSSSGLQRALAEMLGRVLAVPNSSTTWPVSWRNRKNCGPTAAGSRTAGPSSRASSQPTSYA